MTSRPSPALSTRGLGRMNTIDAKTLRKHFRAELDRGTVEANAKVAQSLFQMATQGKNVAAAIFWMKARAGWREKVEIKPVFDDPEQLTDAQLEAIVRSGRVPRPQLEVRLVDETTGAKEEER